MKSQKIQMRSNSILMVCATVLAIFGVTLIGCNRKPPQTVSVPSQNRASAEEVLTKFGKLAEDSFRRAHWAPRRDFKVLRKHGEDFSHLLPILDHSMSAFCPTPTISMCMERLKNLKMVLSKKLSMTKA